MTPNQILTLRKRLGINKAAFADKLNVRRDAVTRYESGERYPPESVLERLKALKIEADILENPHILPSRIYEDKRGLLRVWGDLPFAAVRKFTIQDVPPRESRGCHAHQTCNQIITSMVGQCRLIVTKPNGVWQQFKLIQGRSVYVPKMHWIELKKFVPETVVMVLCSEQYAPERDITDKDSFLGKI